MTKPFTVLTVSQTHKLANISLIVMDGIVSLAQRSNSLIVSVGGMREVKCLMECFKSWLPVFGMRILSIDGHVLDHFQSAILALMMPANWHGCIIIILIPASPYIEL